MYKWIIGILTLTNWVSAQEPEPSNQELVEGAVQVRRDLAAAQKMFNPWYTGPIVAGSASMMPPGLINFQPYLYLIDNFAAYNEDRRSVNQPDLWEFNPEFVLLTGITSWMDCAVIPQFFSNNRHSQWYTNFGDLGTQLGFKICDEGVYLPKMKVAINETFPTGPYQKLNPKKQGTDAIGGGSYVTGFTFRASKLLFWWTAHPVASRMVLTYNIPSSVHVKGLNSYGGGPGTNGSVRPGNSFNADLGLELSLSQKWVLATDIVYQTNNRTKFTGDKGADPITGAPNAIGSGSSDLLQLAPALEYNYNENLGIISGVWFTVYGRNTSNFINYVLSLTYTFSVK